MTPVIQALPAPMMENKENVEDAIVPFQSGLEDNEMDDFDLVAILNEVEKQEESKKKKTCTVTEVATTSTQNVVNNIPKSLFHNCTIQNLTLNFNSK